MPSERLLFAPSLEDIERIIEVADNMRDKLMIRILAFAGLRESEMVGNAQLGIPGLHVNDIVWGNKRLLIRGKGWRTGKVPLAEQPIDAVTLEWLERFIKERNLQGEDRLFDITPRNLQYIVKNLAIKAGVPNAKYMSPHRIRAHYVTRVADEYDIDTARKLARHKSIRTTARYSYVTEKLQKKYEALFEGRKADETQPPYSASEGGGFHGEDK